jgi:hypothetical protein
MVCRNRLLALLAALPALLGAACDNTSCRTVKAAVGALCMPDAIDTDRDVRLDLRELCGRNCARPPSCTATLTDGALVLDVNEEECNDVNLNLCPSAPCQQRVVGCRLPPLPAGDYTIRAPGLADQLLKVRPGGAGQCALQPLNVDAGT